jgi:hypothetical protein
MDDLIYQKLNSIAPTFYKIVPRDDLELPLINYFYVSAEPLYKSDNTYSKSKRFIVQIECFDWKNIEDFADTIEEAMKELDGILRRTDWITDMKAQGIRFEFEFHKVVPD